MAKEMKQPQSKLRDNEKVIYSTSAQTSGFIIMGEGGYLYLTNKRLFMEKIGTGDVRYSFELNVIDDCRKGLSINWFWITLLPLVVVGGLASTKYIVLMDGVTFDVWADSDTPIWVQSAFNLGTVASDNSFATSYLLAPLKTGVTYLLFNFSPAHPNMVSYNCPKFILEGTPNGFNITSTVSPVSVKGISSSGTIIDTIPLFPCLPDILSPIDTFLF